MPSTPRLGRYAFVLNPAAQGGRARRQRPALVAAARAAGLDADVIETGAPGEGARLAAALADSHDVVVAVGGDGTIQEVVNGLAGRDVLFGVVPMGTGNDFAHAIGMPDGLTAAVRALASAPIVPLDVGRFRWQERADGGRLVVRERLFANCLGTGFDALAALGAARYKLIGGRTAYLAAVLRGLWVWRQPEVDAVISVGAAVPALVPASGLDDGLDDIPDGETVVFDGPLFLCEVGNGHSVGGGFLLTPDARPDDGALDVCTIRHIRPGRALRLLPTAFDGSHVRQPEVETHRVQRVVIRATRGVLPVHADGEGVTLGAHAVEAEVWAGALPTLAPRIVRAP